MGKTGETQQGSPGKTFLCERECLKEIQFATGKFEGNTSSDEGEEQISERQD